LEVVNRFENNTGTEGNFTLGGLTVHLGGGPSTIGYRYVKGILPLDVPVYVLGVAREVGHIGAPADEGGGKWFLSSHRSEEQLEKKYKRAALLRGLLAVGLLLFGSIFVIIGMVAGISAVSAAASVEPSMVLALVAQNFALHS